MWALFVMENYSRFLSENKAVLKRVKLGQYDKCNGKAWLRWHTLHWSCGKGRKKGTTHTDVPLHTAHHFFLELCLQVFCSSRAIITCHTNAWGFSWLSKIFVMGIVREDNKKGSLYILT